MSSERPARRKDVLRITSAALSAVIFIMLSCLHTCAGGGRLYAEYVPRTERGTLFYLDIYYDGDISAAIFEITYDSSVAEYRSWAAEHDSSTFKAKAEGGTVRLIFGDSGSIKGKICRLRFKQLSDGAADFTLRMTEGADGGLSYIDPPSAYTVTAVLDTGSSGSAGSSGLSGSSRSTRSSYSGSKSDKSVTSPSDGASGGDPPAVRELTRDDRTLYFILGAGTAVLAALLIALGFILGRRSRKKKGSVTVKPNTDPLPDPASTTGDGPADGDNGNE